MKYRAPRSRGMVLMFLLVATILLLVPILLSLSHRSNLQMRHAKLEAEGRKATVMSRVLLLDYMRQFTETGYIEWSDPNYFKRPEWFAQSGYSSVEFTPDPNNQLLTIKALGKGNGPLGTQRRLDAVIAFINEYARYYIISEGDYTPAGNNTYDGGVYCVGNIDHHADFPYWKTGPVIATGNITLKPGARIDGDVYLGGTLNYTGTQISGIVYHFVPKLLKPKIDVDYYRTRAKYYTSGGVSTYTFQNTGTIGQVSKNGGPFEDLPPTGAIFFSENGQMVVEGPLRGRATFVCSTTDLSLTDPRGTIVVEPSFGYYTGSNYASADAAAAFLVTKWVVKNSPTDPKKFSGMVYSAGNLSNLCLIFKGPLTGIPRSFFGSRNKLASSDPYDAIGVYFLRDPNLMKFAPPGIPLRPVIVSYQEQG